MDTKKKTILLEFISFVVVIAIIAAMVVLFSKGMRKANDLLDDAYGEIQTGEQSSPNTEAPETEVPGTETPGESTDSGNTDSGNTDTGESGGSVDTGTPDSGPHTLSYANGDFNKGVRSSSTAGNVVIIYTDNLKPNTEYTLSWSFDSTYESKGLDIAFDSSDGEVLPFFRFTTTYPTNGISYSALKSMSGSTSFLLNNSYTITTSSEPYFEFAPFLAEYSTEQTVINSQCDALASVINYITLTEVVS